MSAVPQVDSYRTSDDGKDDSVHGAGPWMKGEPLLPFFFGSHLSEFVILPEFGQAF